MQQILFHLPIIGIPVYGYGLMLFFAFLGCNWLAQRMCRREGIDPALIPDLVIWLFVIGIAGGRVVYVIQYWHNFANWHRMFALWDGGLVLYGALIGGISGFLTYYYFIMRKYGVSMWKMLDVIAASVALGVALGRVGCLFTGCCYGNVACEGRPAIHFPMPTAPWADMVDRGHQTPYGFVLREGSLIVDSVEPDTEAEDAGLKPGDEIVVINKKPALLIQQIADEAAKQSMPLVFEVRRGGENVTLSPFLPRSIGVNPTQIYETISMILLLGFLLSYHPFKRRDGELMVYLMVGYAIHRYLNEMLRTDTDPVAFGLTLSQNISLAMLISATLLAIVVWRRGPIAPPDKTTATPLISDTTVRD